MKSCPVTCWKTHDIFICLPYPTNHFLALCKEECVHGTCVEPDSCQCFKGWSGNTCNKCIKMPGCMNGDCIDTSNACFCHEGKVIDTKYYKYVLLVPAFHYHGIPSIHLRGFWPM